MRSINDTSLNKGGSKMYQMTTFDSLVNDTMRDLNRLAIGFEPTLRRLQVTHGQSGNQNGYPPFNIEKLDDNNYRIMIAVAGFTMDDLDITLADNQLTVIGDIKDRNESRVFLHKGIAERGFSRSFILADHIHVMSASLEHGMLVIDLQHELPEALKPRKISINTKGVIDSDPLSVITK